MGDVMAIDVEKKPIVVTKSKKRKRDSFPPFDFNKESRESKIGELTKELDGLFSYFKEVSGKDLILEDCLSSADSAGSPVNLGNQLIACLLEESDLPFSKLVEKVYDKLKSREGSTLVSVRSSVLSIGERVMYGVANADADVLEDCSEKCLWCWQARDLKLIPKEKRGNVSIRRACRKKIHDRITAVSATIAALQAPDIHPNHKGDLMKAFEKLAKVFTEADIRLFVENMMQKNGTELAEKEAKIKEKEIVKELEKSKRENEKEKKKMEREHLKEKLQKEKEQKRLAEEAEKEERLREVEKKKQIRRQQEEAERDHRRQEKEEAQLKEKLALKKQATIMERFLKCKTKNSGHQDNPSSKSVVLESSNKENEEIAITVTSSMDSIFSLKDNMDTSELQRSHCEVWNKLGRSIRSGNSGHWGMRQKPKTALIKELKLLGFSKTEALDKSIAGKKSSCNSALNVEKVDVWEDTIPEDRLGHNSCVTSLTDIQISRIKKLLQFDKSPRPAYYGTLSSKSDVIGPRHPFSKDQNLDYEVQSDEEWEEEDPGESLSDCDKDEEEVLAEGNSKVDEDDVSEDGFLVPDGYLSENEGVQVDSMETNVDDDITCSPRSSQDLESEEFRALFRQQKHVNNLTEQALQKNQPLIISNLMCEKNALVTAEDLNGSLKLERMFLQALSLRPFFGTSIEISAPNSTIAEDQEIQESQCNGGGNTATTATPVADYLDKDLSKIVLTIQSCSHGINKVVETLQQSFPAVSKAQLNRKIREVSNFVDNRWQVRKEILDKLGVTISSPEKSVERTKSAERAKSVERTRGITAFFSKRCLPPAGGPIKMDETSPQQKRKTEMHDTEGRIIMDLS